MTRFSHRLLSLIALLVFSFSQSALAGRVLNRTVVIVNDQVILESDIAKFKRKIKSKSFQELFGGIDLKILDDRHALIQLLVDEKLIDQQVQKLDLSVTEQEIDGQIKAIVTRNGITTAQLKARLAQLGTSMDDYRDGIRRQTERRHLIEREIKPTLEISDEQLRHYFKQIGGDKKLESQYRIAHILIETGGKKRAQSVFAEVSTSNKEFGDLVREFSDDSSSVDTGGLLGTFSAASLSGEFRKIVPTLKQGEISNPIKTAAGYHIIKVLAVEAPNFKTLPKAQQEMIKTRMLSDEVEKKMRLWLSRKKSEAYIRYSPKK